MSLINSETVVYSCLAIFLAINTNVEMFNLSKVDKCFPIPMFKDRPAFPYPNVQR